MPGSTGVGAAAYARAVTSVPPAILDHVLGRIARTWGGRGDEAVAAAQAAVPRTLPLGEVTRLTGGGPFGWLADARLDEEDGRLVLEVLEDSRMAGPDHYRVWADGTVEPLETVHMTVVYPKDATDEEQAERDAAFFAHNRRVGEALRARGFGG